jgi:hypothetical protein
MNTLKKINTLDNSVTKKYLLSSSAEEKIYALSLINNENIDDLLDEIKICAYDHRETVRIFAYKALMYAKTDDIKEVLKDALRDEKKSAFQAARDLFDYHRNIK